MRWWSLLLCLVVGCASHRGTISPQAQGAISSLPPPVISAFRRQFTEVESAQTRTRLLPDRSFEYVITFTVKSGERQSVRYRADGSRIE